MAFSPLRNRQYPLPPKLSPSDERSGTERVATSFRHHRHFYSSCSTSGMTLSLPQKRSAALPQPKEKHQPSARKPHPSKRPLHPEGVDTSQPRVATEGSAPWVRRSRGTNPEGVPHVASGCTTPSGLGWPGPRFPGCAPASRPWAVMDNPFGVQRSSGHREFAERAKVLSRHANLNGLQCRSEQVPGRESLPL